MPRMQAVIGVLHPKPSGARTPGGFCISVSGSGKERRQVILALQRCTSARSWRLLRVGGLESLKPQLGQPRGDVFG